MLAIVIQHGDRRAGADLVVHGPGKKSTVIGPGCAQSFALEAGQSLKLTVRDAASSAAAAAATSTEDPS